MPTFKELLQNGFWNFSTYALVYAIFVVPAFFIFWRWFKQRFQARRIQQKPKSTPKVIRHEIKYSIVSLLIFAVVDVLIYVAMQNGYTKIYMDVGEHGWIYLVFTAIAMILINDAWFYWTHRLMHHPRLFRHIHLVHHRSIDPSPFAAFSFHPLEALVEIAIYVIIAFSFPVHLFALLAWQIFQMAFNVLGHLGYEIFPKGFNRHWLFQWKTPSTHHNLHHSKFKGNYGLYFTWWDRWFGTELKEYHRTFEQIHERLE